MSRDLIAGRFHSRIAVVSEWRQGLRACVSPSCACVCGATVVSRLGVPPSAWQIYEPLSVWTDSSCVHGPSPESLRRFNQICDGSKDDSRLGTLGVLKLLIWGFESPSYVVASTVAKDVITYHSQLRRIGLYDSERDPSNIRYDQASEQENGPMTASLPSDARVERPVSLWGHRPLVWPPNVKSH